MSGPEDHVAGTVLAGGKSSHTGGMGKCPLALGDKPLLTFVVARLEPQCAIPCINANGDGVQVGAFAVGRHDAAYAEFPAEYDLDPFFNIHAPEDLETAHAILRKGMQ